MQSTCKVFLAPRARDGEPDVLITRQPSGLLLGAVCCTCPRDGDCKTHSADELLRRARDHHERVAPLHPCKFTMNLRNSKYETPLTPGTVLLNGVPAGSPYGPSTAQSVVPADPANVTPGKLLMLSYLPPASFLGLDDLLGLDDDVPGVVFEKGVKFEFRFAD